MAVAEALVGHASHSRLRRHRRPGDVQRAGADRKSRLLSLLVHVLTVVIAWCVVQSIAAPAAFGQIFQLLPPVMLITMLPISIAGWGVREATMGLGVRLCRADAERGRQRLAAVRRGLLHGRRGRRIGLDPQRGKGRAGLGADRGSRQRRLRRRATCVRLGKILVVSQHYPPDPTTTATYIGDIAARARGRAPRVVLSGSARFRPRAARQIRK